jgi:hypothetical protein
MMGNDVSLLLLLLQYKPIQIGDGFLLSGCDISLSLQFLHGIVQEEVDQDCISLGARMLPQDFSSYGFDSPDTTSPNLAFPRATFGQSFLRTDVGFQWWR